MIARILRALGDCSRLRSDTAIARMMTIAGVLTLATAIASLISPRFEGVVVTWAPSHLAGLRRTAFNSAISVCFRDTSMRLEQHRHQA